MHNGSTSLEDSEEEDAEVEEATVDDGDKGDRRTPKII